jgi:hypothetical protein
MTIQPLRIVAFPTLVIIVKSIVNRRPYASTSPGLASAVRATSSNFLRNLGASAVVNPSAVRIEAVLRQLADVDDCPRSTR